MDNLTSLEKVVTMGAVDLNRPLIHPQNAGQTLSIGEILVI